MLAAIPGNQLNNVVTTWPCKQRAISRPCTWPWFTTGSLVCRPFWLQLMQQYSSVCWQQQHYTSSTISWTVTEKLCNAKYQVQLIIFSSQFIHWLKTTVRETDVTIIRVCRVHQLHGTDICYLMKKQKKIAKKKKKSNCIAEVG